MTALAIGGLAQTRATTLLQTLDCRDRWLFKLGAKKNKFTPF